MERADLLMISSATQHKPRRRLPACDRCRNRKSRCVLDRPGEACRFCRERNISCNYKTLNPRAKHHSRPSLGPSLQDGVANHKSIASPTDYQLDSIEAESSIMMDPNMSEDIAMLEHYISGSVVETQSKKKPYSTVPGTSNAPIVYLTVPRKRKGLQLSDDPGRTQRDVIEQVLYPNAAEIRKLYFECLHPCFPILDKRTFQEMWEKDRKSISSTLLCDMYASAMVYWHRSPILRHQPRPDLDFLWNTAVAALSDDFLAPTISTVHAALLDMVGRPVRAITGNIVNCGRVVTLAHSLGLHRDPTTWGISDHEKHVRIHLWWGVVTHDHWSSIGHGNPPAVNLQYSDVPLPDLTSLGAKSTCCSQPEPFETFLHLCKLTQILADVLPHAFALRPNLEQSWRTVRKAEHALDEWILALPKLLSRIDLQPQQINGCSNLWFAFLSLRLMVARLSLKLTLREDRPALEARQYRLSALRQASCEIVDFMLSLQNENFGEFWLPYTSYLLVTATTTLLRCTIECTSLMIKKDCIAKLCQLCHRLRQAQTELSWDLADFCLERCVMPVQKLASALGLQVDSQDLAPRASPGVTLAASENLSEVDFGLDFTLDTLEFPWGTMDGPWDMQL